MAARFETLDAWRGLAALGVAIYHIDSSWPGYLAVDFFLILSGFVLSHGYFFKAPHPAPRQFIAHRLARLYPLHLFTLAVLAVVLLISRRGDFPSYPDGNWITLIENLLLIHNVGLNPRALAWNFPSWSVSVEFWVNVLFFFVVTRRTPNLALLAISAAGLALIAARTGHLDVHHQNYFGVLNAGLVRGAAEFALGIVVYRAWRRLAMPIDLGRVSRAEAPVDHPAPRAVQWLEPLSVLALIGLLFGSANRLHDFALVPLFAVLVWVFAFEAGAVSRLLKPLRWLGTLSYSIYLNQTAVLIGAQTLGKQLDATRPMVVLIYLAALLGWSALTYRFVEQPARHWLRARL